jgi:hypothetical protein
MFYLFVFLSIQNPGYVLVFLPALIVVAAFSICRIGNEFRLRHGEKVFWGIVTTVFVLNTTAFFLWNRPVSYRWIKTHDRNLSALLRDVGKIGSGETVVLVNNLIYYSYRHFMVYLPEFRAYNVDVRKSSTGEARKIFWGAHGTTYRQEEVTLPEGIRRFVTPIDREDRKYGERKIYEDAGIEVRDLNRTMFLASGHINLLPAVYPEFRVSSSQREDR